MKLSIALAFAAMLLLSARATSVEAEDPRKGTGRVLQLNSTDPHVAQAQHDFFVRTQSVIAGAPKNAPSGNPHGADVATEKIINGVDADLMRYRSFARLTYGVHGRLSYLCGGVLISDRFVLTAAHCVWNFVDGGLHRDAYGAAVGVVCNEEDNCGFPFVSFRATHYWVHPEWDPNRFVLDIALVRLSKKVPSDVAEPAVPDLGDSFNQLTYGYDNNLKTVGFGWINDAEQFPPRLQTLNLGYIPIELCESRWGRLYDGVICVYTNDDVEGLYGRGLCLGDSGSPTVIPQADGPDIVVGVTSFGQVPCTEKDRPDVLGRVSAAARYIANVVCFPGMSDINPQWCFEFGWRTGFSLEPGDINRFDLTPFTPDGGSWFNIKGIVETENEVPHDMTECVEHRDTLYSVFGTNGTKRCRKMDTKKSRERQIELCGDGSISDAGIQCCSSCLEFLAEQRQAILPESAT